MSSPGVYYLQVWSTLNIWIHNSIKTSFVYVLLCFLDFGLSLVLLMVAEVATVPSLYHTVWKSHIYTTQRKRERLFWNILYKNKEASFSKTLIANGTSYIIGLIPERVQRGWNFGWLKLIRTHFWSWPHPNLIAKKVGVSKK